MSAIRRAPKYYHHWCLMSAMPPLKHSDTGRSAVLDWLMEHGRLERQVAAAAFSSAKQAKYLVMREGHWHWDARSGYDHWHKPKPAPTDELQEARAKIAALEADQRPRLGPEHLRVLMHLTTERPAKADAPALAMRVLGCDEQVARECLNALYAHGLIDLDGQVVEAMRGLVAE